MMAMEEFQKELTGLINRHSIDSFAETPDYLLAAHLCSYLAILARHHDSRDMWGKLPSGKVNPNVV